MSRRRPTEALRMLRSAAATGDLEAFCHAHDITLLVAFGSTVSGPLPDSARDLDLAFMSGTSARLDLLADLSTWLGIDEIDLLDLRQGGAVAKVEALLHGEVLYEQSAGTADRLLSIAAVEKMDTQWLRDWALDLMAS